MGNHGIGINLGIAGKLENSNILLTYLYLKHRADYGVGLYNLFDEAYYRRLTKNPEHDYFRTRQRETVSICFTDIPLTASGGGILRIVSTNGNTTRIPGNGTALIRKESGLMIHIH
jgi:hypothetical protein